MAKKWRTDNMIKCYVLYDCPSTDNDKSWVSKELMKGYDTKEVEIHKNLFELSNQGFKGKLYRKIIVVRQCLRALSISNTGDVIVCWNAEAGAIFNFFSRVFGNKRYIFELIWLTPASGMGGGKRILSKLVFSNHKCIMMLNAIRSSEEWKRVLGLDVIKAKCVYFPDVYDIKDDFIVPSKENRKGYIFSGGLNNRDWKKLISIAKMVPNYEFVCVANEEKWKTEVDDAPKNVKAYFDLPVDNYYSIMRNASLVVMPLEYDMASGFINIIKSAVYGKLILVSDYEVVRPYFLHNMECMVKNEVKDWAFKIEQIMNFSDEIYNDKAKVFCDYIRENFSPQKAGEILRGEIDKIDTNTY